MRQSLDPAHFTRSVIMHFTAFADAEGDEAAIAAVDRFFETVALERGDDSRLMKALGDGVMRAH